MHVEEEFLASGLSSWNDEVVVETFIVFVEGSDLGVPMNPVALGDTVEVVEAHSLVWELDLGSTLPAIAEAEFVLVEGGSEGPHTGEDEESFVDALDLLLIALFLKALEMIVLSLVSWAELLAKLVNDSGKGIKLSKLAYWSNVILVPEVVKERVIDIGGQSKSEHILSESISVLLVLGQPGVEEWLPSNIVIVDEEYTTTGDSGWGSTSQVGYLENKSHGIGHWNTLLRHEGQHFVVIHDSVERLNPLWIDITIQDDPLLGVACLVWGDALVHIFHDDREYTILPLVGLGVHESVELVCGDGLRINDIEECVFSSGFECISKSLPHGRL